jgi:hypothetical protein
MPKMSAREMQSPDKPHTSSRFNYKVQSLVVEVEIQPKHKLERYDRDVQCEIIDSKKAERLQRAQDEEDEYGEEDDAFEARMARAMRSDMKRGPTIHHQTGVVQATRDANKLCSKCQAEKESNVPEP